MLIRAVYLADTFSSLETQTWCYTSSREPSLITQAAHLLPCSLYPQTLSGCLVTCCSNSQ